MSYRTAALRVLLASCVLAFACPTAQAALIAYEGFEDNTVGQILDGNGNGGSGWDNDWNILNGRASEVTVQSSTMSYANGGILVDGGANMLRYIASEDSIQAIGGRDFPTQSDTVYMSFLMEASANGETLPRDDFYQMGFTTSTYTGGGAADINPLVSALDRNGTIQVRSGTAASGTVDSGITTGIGNTFFLVLRAEKTGASSTYNDLTLYINPDNAVEGLNTNVVSTTVDSGLNLSGNAAIAIRKAFLENGDTYLLDEIRIGSKFADVITVVPEPTTLLIWSLLAGLGVGLGWRRRK